VTVTGEADVRLDGIQEDIRGIRVDMTEMRKLLQVVAAQEQKIIVIERDIKDLRKDHDGLETQVRSIRETCISRESLVRAGEKHLQADVPAETFWARLVASATTGGIWVVLGAVVSYAVGRVLG
jgi:predicted  nucleic acid-binding Zn-ribbon protein